MSGLLLYQCRLLERFGALGRGKGLANKLIVMGRVEGMLLNLGQDLFDKVRSILLLPCLAFL